jgi:hypothetical protein
MIARRNTPRLKRAKGELARVNDLIDKVSSLDASSLDDVSLWRFLKYKYFCARLHLCVYGYEYRNGSLPFS